MKKMIVFWGLCMTMSSLCSARRYALQGRIDAMRARIAKKNGWDSKLLGHVICEQAGSVEAFLRDKQNARYAAAARGKAGRTFLHLVARPVENNKQGHQNRMRIAQALLQAGVPKDTKDDEDKTPFDYVQEEPDFEGNQELGNLLQ